MNDVNDLDIINARKFHRLTKTLKNTIRLLQHLKLLRTVIKDSCSKGCSNWYMDKSTRYNDGMFSLGE